MLGRLFSWLQALAGRRRFEEEMAAELRFHVEELTADLVRSGMPPEEAARRARMELGSVDNVKADCRQARGLRLLDELQQDVGQSLRRMGKTRTLTATALATLALCLGANLTIFAAVDGILLRPLPFPEAGRLVSVYNTYPKAGVPNDGCSLPNYYERRGHIAAFSGVAAYRERAAIVGEAGATERRPVARVSPDFFATLGSRPALGRTFSVVETTYETDDVVILTDGYWRQRLAADPDVIGRRMRVDGVAHTVVGVLPPGFRFLSSPAEIYLPLASDLEERAPDRRHSGTSRMIARLRPGATLAQAQAEVDAHNAAVEAHGPQARAMAEAGFRSVVEPLHAGHVAAIRPTLLLLQAGALFLLLVGAVNLANLLLLRASGRSREFALRRWLGAGRRHVATEVLVETTLLTLSGALLGLAVGAAGIRLLAVLGTDRLPLGTRISFDGRLALVALAGALALGVAISLPIVAQLLREHGGEAARPEPRGGTAGREAQRLRHAFVVAQIAVAFVLLAGAGLLSLSLARALEVSPGFQPEHALSGQLSLPWKSYPDTASRLAFLERLAAELRRQPGVAAVGVLTNVPFSGIDNKSAVHVKGYQPRPGETLHGHYSYGVVGDAFAALGLSLREGRFLTAGDARGTARGCVVDEDFARLYWPRGRALGQRLFPGSEAGEDAEAFTVVGVVGRVRQADLTDGAAQGAVYYPYPGLPNNDVFVVSRTSLPAESLGRVLAGTVRRLDPELPVTDLRPMEARLADSLVARRSPALLAGLFSAMALLLAALGIYGVLGHAVAGRRREIGLRMALGARPAEVRRQFVSLGLRLLAAGTLLGTVGAWLAGQALRSVLFGVPALPVSILAGATAVLGTVSLAACLLPASRAARISPLAALAGE